MNQRENLSSWITKGIKESKNYMKNSCKKEMLLIKQLVGLFETAYLKQLSVSPKKLTKDTPI